MLARIESPRAVIAADGYATAATRSAANRRSVWSHQVVEAARLGLRASVRSCRVAARCYCERRAAVEDKVIAPGEVVTNDFYIREDGHKLLTLSVPGNARVTVVTNEGPDPRLTPIHVFELARVASGHRPKRQYVNPRSGFWAYITGNTARRLDQQYLPCPPECQG
jgi:hypothetical protein